MLTFDEDTLAGHRALVARMATGDAEALQLLFLEFSAPVHGIARRILEDPEDAREAVQETFIKAWQQARAYRHDRGEVGAWLVFIARHAALDRVRRGARRRLLHHALPREPDPAFASAVGNSSDPLSFSGGELDAAERQALDLAYFGGWNQADIAATMRIPVSTVRSHLQRGLQKLRQRGAGVERPAFSGPELRRTP